ncbi:2-oxo-4-hydroxy-4-carboxy-5-ureidoimidazoline decarboxylase [uncultured Ruegeria sp.]|uniref:2-oxo-4-hydroxy-4-carboxy-5-ureidoimidazoline decarboxylase n=1 Tax=uncultured Ruegeria sp. TaxID=259304 RepID=UPI00263072D9|nr:2-oxo-4-hydroxy-4-carboxy-5-ureidoimidazoline decarboxylase [uncultured Ruegeria sp.]
MDRLKQLNSAEEAQAVNLLSPMIERAPKIAARVAKQRPFTDVHALNQAIRTELNSLSISEKIDLFLEHPELAPRNPLSMTEASQDEQGRLDLTGSTNRYRQELYRLNAQYREKFGFPFIIALVRHDTMESVLSEFETRIRQTRDTEIAAAIEQVMAVSASRVKRAFENTVTQS